MTTTAGAAMDEAGLLWLASLQRAMGRVSHDMKDSLNGVSVNLEVIRSRAEKPETPASAVGRFAEAASQQLDRLTDLIEAVLVLGRPARDPADVALILRPIATMCSASALHGDALVELHEIDAGLPGGTITRVRGDVVRLALLAPLLEVVASTDHATRTAVVRCTIGGDAADVRVSIGAGGRRLSMPDAVAPALRAGGVSWSEDSLDFSLAFPRA